MMESALHHRTQALPGSLREFQDGFARALVETETGPGCAPSVAGLVSQPGFAVYRNTVLKGCIDALQCNFPAVARLVGEEWFRAAASVYVRSNLPRNPSLLDYGDTFPVFLHRFGPAQAFPYLPDVARIDRFWTEAHSAPDEAPLSSSMVASLSPGELARTTLRPHPTARWAWFDGQPAFTIWCRNRSADDREQGTEIEWCGEGALLLRPFDAVAWMPLDAAGCAFMDACGRGETLALAATAAMVMDPLVDLAGLMSRLLGAAAFAAIAVSNRAEEAA
jgi:hypothetical protein